MDNLMCGESISLRPIVLVPAAYDRHFVPLRGQMEAYLADYLGNRRKIGMEVLVYESDFQNITSFSVIYRARASRYIAMRSAVTCSSV